MTAKAILALALAAAMGAATTATAANLTVNQGETRNLANGDAYDAIVVNGTLTIPAGASATATSLTVADGDCDASVTLGSGASLTLTGDIHLGYDGGQARLMVQNGASLTVGGSLFMAFGHRAAPAADATPTRAYLTVSTNATVTINGANGLYFYHSEFWPNNTSDNSTSVDTVRLETGAAIKFAASGGGIKKNCVKQRSARSSTIFFAGGCIEYKKRGGGVFSHEYNAAFSTLNLVSEGGNPILLKDTNSGNVASTTWFAPGSKSCWFSISGAGDLVLERVTTADNLNWASPTSWDSANPNVKFLTGGRIRLAGCKLVSYPENAFSNIGGNCLRSLILENGATFDMKGVDAEFTSVYGAVANSTAVACTLSMGGDNSDISYPFSLPAGVTLAKKGTGQLSVVSSDTDGVDVQDGALALKGRAEIGYPFYKFNVYGTSATGANNHQVRISEFKFLDGETDVTQGWDAYYYSHAGTSYYSEPTNMWDGDTSTDFYDQRDQNWAAVSNIHATVEYRPSRKVTGYTWHITGFTGGSDGGWSVRGNTPPTRWALFGSLDNASWTRLDLVEGFTPAGRNPGQWCGTNFVCRYDATTATLGALSIALGATLTVDGAEVSAASVSADAALPVALTHGASLTLPAETEIASLSADVGAGGGALVNFRPSYRGAAYLTGDMDKPRRCVLPVAVGTLLGDNLSSWRVYVDGVLTPHCEIFVNSSGFLETRYTGATVMMVK
jgi:hypothetical protein